MDQHLPNQRSRISAEGAASLQGQPKGGSVGMHMTNSPDFCYQRRQHQPVAAWTVKQLSRKGQDLRQKTAMRARGDEFPAAGYWKERFRWAQVARCSSRCASDLSWAYRGMPVDR